MKQLLLLTAIFFVVITSFSQTTWTGLGANTNWNNTDNWDTNLVPTAADDVIIPTGFNVTQNVVASVKSLDIQGTSVFEMTTAFSFTDTYIIGASATVNWVGGTVAGGGIVTNDGTINTFASSAILNGVTTLNNNNLINLTSSGDIFIGQDCVLNNTVSGTIDFQGDNSGISATGLAPRILNNTGLIKTSFPDPSDVATIGVEFTNNDGTIQVENGTLNLANTSIVLNDGTYNVFANGILDWDSAITISGTLTGTLTGLLNWKNNLNVPTTATFAFDGTEIVNWISGTLLGGGTLDNTNKIHTYASSAILNGATTLNNKDTINLTGAGDIFIGENCFLNNEAGATIDFQGDNSGISATGLAPRNLINTGLIKTSFPDPSDFATIGVEFTNNDGTIQVENGILNLANANIVLNDGTYNVFANGILDWDSAITISGTLTGTLTGLLNWKNNLNVATTATFEFGGTEIVNWLSGALQGGGVLDNTNKLHTSSSNVFINGATTLNNKDTINLTGAGDLFIFTDSILNNELGATIDFQASSSGISASGIAPRTLNNFGLIKATLPDPADFVTINVELNNNDGTIQVESGILNLANISIALTDGTYNTFTNGTLDWDSTVNLTGTLTGTLDGALNWRNIVNVISATSATLNFGGASPINWVSGSLAGGGTLINQSIINVLVSNVFINGASILSNENTLNMTDAGDLFVATNGVISNEINGVIDFQADSGNFSASGILPHDLNNFGTLKGSAPTLANIGITTNNSGTVEVNSGELQFSSVFNNETAGIVMGTADFDPPLVANFTNDGTFAPGASPGTLSVLGDFTSSGTSVLDVELDGLVQDTEYDLLAIQGDAVLEGSVNITMGFEAEVGNTFTVATTTGTITTGNLTTPVIVDHDGKRYTFDITYPGNNAVLLTISDKLDIQVPDVVTQDITVQLDATGNVSITEAQIDDGSSDNCSLTANLVFSLDITDFDCSDVGPNTVTLTVTDEAGLSDFATATVTVEDSIDPIINCPGNSTVMSAGNYTLPDYVFDGDVTASDNCSYGIVQTPAPGTSLPDGDHVISFVVTDAGSNTANCSFMLKVVDTTLSVEDYEFTDSDILLFPNPASGDVTLRNNSSVELLDLKIIDIKGSVIENIDLRGMTLDKIISIQNYSNGVYFMRIEAQNTTLTKRLIKH